jgi:DNA modification methylase
MPDLFQQSKKITTDFEPTAEITLYQGDVNELLAKIPANFVKLIITSPPYNLGKQYETKVSIEEYLSQQREIIAKFSQILHEAGSICWQVGNFVNKGEVFPLDIFYYPIFKEHGFFLRNRIIWHFGHGLHASKRFSGRYETLLWFTKSEKYTFNLDAVRVPSKYPGKRHYKGTKKGELSGNPQGKNPSDFWEIITQDWENGVWEIPNVKANHPEKTVHPCQFPVELVERCVLALTNEDDWVFDPYAGVGSSLIASVKHQRRALGSEKEPAYIAIAQERLTAFLNGSLPLRPLGKPIHTPTGKEKVAQVPDEWILEEQGE